MPDRPEVRATSPATATLTVMNNQNGSRPATATLTVVTSHGTGTPDAENMMQLNALLSIRQGNDGIDGVSPSIAVKESTPTSYILTITDASGTFDTPNLLAGSGAAMMETKVDKDLSDYELVNPYLLSQSQREQAALYIDNNGQYGKVTLDTLALTREVEERVRLKLQSSDGHPDDWGVGDFIFNSRLTIGS